jgi:hypothetical protein
MGLDAYFGSVACRLIGTNAGHWHLWDEANGNWVATTYPCTASTIAAGTWHHLQLYVTFSTANLNYAYQTLVFDGTTVFQTLGQTFGAKLQPTWATNEVNIEQQIDNNGNVGAALPSITTAITCGCGSSHCGSRLGPRETRPRSRLMTKITAAVQQVAVSVIRIGSSPVIGVIIQQLAGRDQNAA